MQVAIQESLLMNYPDFHCRACPSWVFITRRCRCLFLGNVHETHCLKSIRRTYNVMDMKIWMSFWLLNTLQYFLMYHLSSQLLHQIKWYTEPLKNVGLFSGRSNCSYGIQVGRQKTLISHSNKIKLLKRNSYTLPMPMKPLPPLSSQSIWTPSPVTTNPPGDT